MEGNASDLGGISERFDLAFCRFVLEFMSDPVHVIREMASVVKPDGQVCAYEWHNSPTAIWPDCPHVRRVWRGIYDLQSALCGDADVAMKLLGIFTRAGMKTIDLRVDAFAFTNESGRLCSYVDGAREILGQTRQALLDRDLITDADLVGADEEYEALVDRPDAIIVEVMCCATAAPP